MSEARKSVALCAGLIAVTLAACRTGSGNTAAAPVLLFDGFGTSEGDVAAIEKLLRAEQLSYTTVNTPRLNGMSEADILRHRLLIVPGGNFVKIGNGLTARTSANIRDAVHSGLNYLGICAGAFVAGNSPYNGLNLTSGIRFGFYSAESQGVRKAPVAITTPDGQTHDQYWEDGPQLTGWGEVVAKYPDGTAAIAQGSAGGGWVILTGVHPEAPASWRRGTDFRTSAESDNAYAVRLIRAALNREALPHY